MKQNASNIAIHLSHVSKRYTIHHEKPTLVERLANGKDEEFWALKDINLTIRKGERVGIIGPNGSGKTTLLKIIAGITTPTSGTVETHGKIVSLIDLEAGFHPDLTGIQNVYLNGMLLGMKKGEIDGKLDAITRFADINQFIDAPLFTYSAGMKLRLSAAIAMHCHANIIIIDELIIVGDSEFREKILHHVHGFANNIALILTSHSFGLIHRFCTRMIKLKRGKLVLPDNSLISFLKHLDVYEEFIAEAASGSMEPYVKRGNKLVIKKVPFSQLKLHDVIVFAPDHIPEIIVHRVVHKEKIGSETIFTTQGDATINLDPWMINKRNYLGKVIAVLPHET